MKSFDTDLKEYAEKVRLKAAERRELRERILSYMEYHPLPKKREQVISQHAGIVSEPFFIFHFNTFYARVAAGAFAFILVVIVPTLAERSVPGDALYLVKTEVNEVIRGNFADTPYEKVAYETKLIERRIAEARLLASEGKLTEEVEAQIAETVKSHASAAQDGIAELRTSDADEAAIASIAFDSALQVQSAVLDVGQGEGDTSSTAGILDAVNTVREEVVANRGTSTPSYEGLVARIELETTRAYELFTAIKASATEEEISDIERRLQDSDRKILEARATQEHGEEGAVSGLTEALGLLQKLIVFMTDIDVRTTVALETLVPVVPTLEERVAAAQVSIEEVRTTLRQVTERAPSVTDANTLEKVEIGIRSVTELIESATSSLAADPKDIDGAEAKLVEARALVGDLNVLTGGSKEEVPTLPPAEDTTATTTPIENGTPEDTEGDTGVESEVVASTTEPRVGEGVLPVEPPQSD